MSTPTWSALSPSLVTAGLSLLCGCGRAADTPPPPAAEATAVSRQGVTSQVPSRHRSLLAAIHRFRMDRLIDDSGRVDQARARQLRGFDSTAMLRYTAIAKAVGSDWAIVTEGYDEQRLITEEGSYGPMATLNVNAGLKSGNEPPSSKLILIVVATGSYQPLGLKDGSNCFYKLSAKRGTMVAVGGRDCPESAPDSGGTELRIVRAQPRSNNDDYPVAGRIHWDPVHHWHYVGYKCGKGWCEAGIEGFTPETSGDEDGETVLAVKGWHDEQELAIWRDPQVRDSLIPSSVRGTLWPDANLGNVDAAKFEEGWVPVAKARLSADLPAYQTKYNLARSRVTDISLCNKQECRAESTAPACDGWIAKFEGGGKTVYRCVSRDPHGNRHVPGTVRWAWDDQDEAFWMRCGFGCCRVT